MAISGFIMGCGSKQARTGTDNTKGAETTTTPTGAEIYSSKCTACHGVDGNMGIAGAKKLPESVLTQEEREQVITNGKGTMPAFKDKLDPAAVKAVAEYTLTLK